MRKLLILLCTAGFLVFFIPAGVVAAQVNHNQITITEVENLINQKLSEGTSLTKEDLQEEVNRLKDEKIANLEGNLGTVIDSIGIFIGVASLILVGLAAIIGWVINTNIGKKLTKFEELENTIGTFTTDIGTKHRQIVEFHKQVKEFSEETEKVKRQLSKNERVLKQREVELSDLREYVGAIENIANSSIVINVFLNEKQKALEIIKDTKDLLQKPQKHQDYVIMKLSQKLRMNDELNDLDSINKHLDELVVKLRIEEDSLWEKIHRFNSAEKVYINQDENSMTLFEEVASNFEDWKGQLDYINIIKNHWESQLKLNPPTK